MNLGDMLEEVRENLGESVEDFWKTTQIKRALNEGQRRFAQEEKWPWLWTRQDNIPVSAGNPNIELIDDVPVNRHALVRLRKAGDPEPVDPQRVTAATGFRLERRYTDQDEPRWWYAIDSITNTYPDGDIAVARIITLVPTPAVNYTAEYLFLRDPADMTADDDEPDIPEPYHAAIVAWATGYLWLKDNKHTDAQAQFEIYNKVVAQARKDMKELALDELIVWGKEEPEPVVSTIEEWKRIHIPQQLG